MKKKNICKKLFWVAFVLFCVIVFTGCSNAVDESGTVGYVRFADDAKISRNITLEEDPMYPVDSLYWAYTAQKVDGLYTEGESEVLGTSGDTGSDGVKAGGYKLRPVKQGPAPGLRGATVGPFATGDWIFKVYGYLNYKVDSSTGKGKFDGLVYSGTVPTADKSSKVVKVASGTTGDPIVFELSTVTGSAIPDKGKLAFGSMFITVPEEMRFFGTTSTVSGTTSTAVDEKIVVKVFDGTTLIATSKTPVGASDILVGNTLNLNGFVFEADASSSSGFKNIFATGTKKLNFYISYYDAFTESMKTVAYADGGYKYDGSAYAGKVDDGYALVGEILNRGVEFKTGVLTTLSGNLNEMKDSTEDTSDAKFGVYVARIGDVYYKTLEEAFAATSSSANPIVLLRNVSAGTVTGNAVTVNPNGHFINNVLLSDTTDSITSTVLHASVSVEIPTASTAEPVRKYVLTGDGAVLANFSYNGNNVDIITDGGGTLTVDAAADNVFHSGRVANVVIENVSNNKNSDSGFHLDAHRWQAGSTITSVEIDAGFLDIGENVKITILTIGAENGISLKGRLTSTVTNLDSGTSPLRDAGTGTNVSANTGFTKITLNNNPGSGTAVTKDIWGIDGMYLTLPANTLTKTNCLFVFWNKKASPTVADPDIKNQDKIEVGSTAFTLYAQWAVKVSPPTAVGAFNGAAYTFYDSSGTMLTYAGTTPTTSELSTAAFCYVKGKVSGAPNRFTWSGGGI